MQISGGNVSKCAKLVEAVKSQPESKQHCTTLWMHFCQENKHSQTLTLIAPKYTPANFQTHDITQTQTRL